MFEVPVKVIDLINEYSSSLRYVDDDFVMKVINILVPFYGIENQVVNWNVHEQKECLACYSYKRKSINLNTNQVLETYKKDYNNHQVWDDDYEHYLLINIQFLSVIIHELTHAYQQKCIESSSDSLEANILRMAMERKLLLFKDGNYVFNDLNDNEKKFIKSLNYAYNNMDYYKSLPDEKMANYNAFNCRIKILNTLNISKDSNLYKHINLLFYNLVLSGYKTVSPTAYIAYVHNNIKKECGLDYGECDIRINELKYLKLALENRLNLSYRLYYGLPITLNEKQELKNAKSYYSKNLKKPL